MDFQKLNWQSILTFTDINDEFYTLNYFLLSTLDKHAPYKMTIFRKPPCPWITNDINLMISLRKRALIKFKSREKLGHWNYYKDSRNLTSNAIRAEIKAYVQHQFTNAKNDEQKWA
ncbi:hypothetical protein JTB14_035412 [Gonioctena quinquepunctata]|nr:hypothetical protein JTB14_035412 [Gonioctena quinquepunctata]